VIFLAGANPFIDFYGKYNISPVHQDLSNLKLHFSRRENLYRTLGIPAMTFGGKRLLEVGPGGGYNSLYFLASGAQVDLVEPNPKAQMEIKALYAQYGIEQERWSLFPGRIEDYANENGFDIVIAEGFIPGLYERETILRKLAQTVKPGGIIVVTCVDDISLFFDHLKRIIAGQLVKDVADFQDQVKILSEAFEPHYRSLGNASRPIEDWVADMFINQATYGKLFSIEECIVEFGDEFEFLGSSPAMFTNYNWFKNIKFSYREAVMAQFRQKRHTLLLWDLPERLRPDADNRKLADIAFQIRSLAGGINPGNNSSIIGEIIKLLGQLKQNTREIDSRITVAIDEAIELLYSQELTIEKVAKAGRLGSAYGRAQQYVGLIKNRTE
jgi:SAM-dependent methyltransferase